MRREEGCSRALLKGCTLQLWSGTFRNRGSGISPCPSLEYKRGDDIGCSDLRFFAFFVPSSPRPLVPSSPRPPLPRAAGGFGDKRVVGPVVLGVAAFQILADFEVCAAPEALEIARDLHGTAGGREKMKRE